MPIITKSTVPEVIEDLAETQTPDANSEDKVSGDEVITGEEADT